MKLEYLFTYRAALESPQEIGAGPFGNRMIFEVTGGSFESERLNGRLLTGGGDWLLVGPDGYGRLDVRATFETDDGALLYMQYYGVIEMNDGVMAALEGGNATSFGDQYFMTAPRFETGDPRYAWLNQTVTVAEGRVLPSPEVEYRVYRCIND